MEEIGKYHSFHFRNIFVKYQLYQFSDARQYSASSHIYTFIVIICTNNVDDCIICNKSSPNCSHKLGYKLGSACLAYKYLVWQLDHQIFVSHSDICTLFRYLYFQKDIPTILHIFLKGVPKTH